MHSSVPSLTRFEEAVETVAERVRRVTAALERHGVPYEVIGGLAVAAWVARVDPEAVRATRDVHVVIRRSDLRRARSALEEAGFAFREVVGVAMFVDRQKPRVRGGVHLVFEKERVRREYAHPAPALAEDPPRSSEGFRIAPLESLLFMKLTSFRDKDRVHLRDLLEVGLISPEVERTLPPDLQERLRQLRESPES
jgi:hypothetical protein